MNLVDILLTIVLHLLLVLMPITILFVLRKEAQEQEHAREEKARRRKDESRWA